MRSIGRPGPRTASAALCAALCLALAACSGGGGATSPSARPSHSRTASPTEPASGPAAAAAVKANWVTFFNGAIPIPRRLLLLQNGQLFASFVRAQAKTSIGSLVLQAAATVSAVTLQPPGRASVRFSILLGGKPLEKNLHGTAVYTGGSWKIAATTFCSLLRLAYGKRSHVTPAACGT